MRLPADPHLWRRNLLALAVAAMGAVDVLSALLSNAPERLLALVHFVPTNVLDTSRTFTLLAGALLLVAAWGLRRGKRRAFIAALFLCAVSVPVNVLKAFDVEEATVAAALLFALGMSGDAFRVKSREWSIGVLRAIAAWALLGFGLYAVGGCWLIGARYGDASLVYAAQEAAYRLFGIGEPALRLSSALSPAEHRVVSWFLGSLPVLAITLSVGLAIALLRPVAHRGRHREGASRVTELLRRHGDSSIGVFALEPDTDYFFSANRRAVIAYHFESDTLLGIGDPIGPPEEIEPLLREFSEFCREQDWQFAFFQARPDRLPQYRRFGWRAFHIGEDPILWTDRFTLEGSAAGEVRRAVRKLEASGLEARMHFPDSSPLRANAEDERLLDELRSVSAEWMRGRRGEEMGFCMGRFDSEHVRRSWLATAWNPERRRVEGFLTWTPISAREGWALDLMRRRPDAPPGVMEFLVAKSVEAARARGDSLLSLSLSALAEVPSTGDIAPSGTASVEERDPMAERARLLLLRHLNRFYGFESLFHWKKKFQPEFEDRYLIYPAPLALPKIALALVRAQTPGGVVSFLRGKRPLTLGG